MSEPTPVRCPWCGRQPIVVAPYGTSVVVHVACPCGASGPHGITETHAIEQWDAVAERARKEQHRATAHDRDDERR